VPTAGKIVQRIGAILGVEPRITPEEAVKLANEVNAGTVGD
jgi:hypothetical protein